MSIVSEKGGGSFHGSKLLLCENPLPPIATLQHEDQHMPGRPNCMAGPWRSRQNCVP